MHSDAISTTRKARTPRGTLRRTAETAAGLALAAVLVPAAPAGAAHREVARHRHDHHVVVKRTVVHPYVHRPRAVVYHPFWPIRHAIRHALFPVRPGFVHLSCGAVVPRGHVHRHRRHH